MSYVQPLPGDSRLTTFPICRQEIWNMYKTALRSIWFATEIDLSTDRDDYLRKLSPKEQRPVDYTLAFFASLDKLVNINITERFKKDFSIYEVDLFYDFQVVMENIHGETYSLLLDTIIADESRKEFLLNSIKEIPVIKKMADWIYSCIDSDKVIGERLIRMAIVEGVFFIGSFCLIYWLQDRGLMKGLGQSNELIARDESFHTTFSLYMYSLLKPEYKISYKEIKDLFRQGVEIASEFIRESLAYDLFAMNSTLMIKYIECSVDNLLTLLGLPNMYNSKNPFHFMININLKNRTNFFERRITEYSKSKDISESLKTVDNF